MTYKEAAIKLGATLNKYGLPLRCPNSYGLKDSKTNCFHISCTECWNREMEEVN